MSSQIAHDFTPKKFSCARFEEFRRFVYLSEKIVGNTRQPLSSQASLTVLVVGKLNTGGARILLEVISASLRNCRSDLIILALLSDLVISTFE